MKNLGLWTEKGIINFFPEYEDLNPDKLDKTNNGLIDIIKNLIKRR